MRSVASRAVVLGALLAVLGCVGCSPSFRASYDTTSVRRASSPRLDVVLDIATLRDARRRDRASAILFQGDQEVDIGGDDSCVNAEANYEAGVARQLTRTLADHMRRRGVLRAVTLGRPVQADYRLTGEIGALYGVQETSGTAEAGTVIGGLIGGAIAATAKSPARVRIVFQNLAIHDPSGRVVARPADVELDFRGELFADAYCNSIYQNVNDKLRTAVDLLAVAVERAVRAAELGVGEDTPPAVATPAPPAPPPGECCYGELTVHATDVARPGLSAPAEIAAAVLINGRYVGVTPFTDGLPVGGYVVVVQHPDGRTFRQQVALRNGERRQLRAEFRPPPTAAELAMLAQQRRAAQEAARQRRIAQWEADHAAWQRGLAQTEDARAPLTTAAWITAGAGAALVGAGVFFVVEAVGAHDDARSTAARWGMATTASDQANLQRQLAEDQSDRDTYGALGASFLAVGGASLASSLVLLIARPGFDEEPVRPVASRDGVGLVVGGSL